MNVIQTIEKNDRSKDKYLNVKEKLEKLYINECKGAGIRSRIRWMEEGEKNTIDCQEKIKALKS